MIGRVVLLAMLVGGALGVVLATAGVGMSMWQFWAVMVGVVAWRNLVPRASE